MGSKAKTRLKNLLNLVEVIPDRFVNVLKENQELFECSQAPNVVDAPEVNGFEYFGAGKRKFYYIKKNTE